MGEDLPASMTNQIRLVFFDIGGVVIRADLERYVHVGCALLGADPAALRREVTSRVPALERGALDSATFWKQVSETLWRRGEGRLVPPEQCRYLWRDILAATAEIDSQVMDLCFHLRVAGTRVGALTNTIEDHIPVLTSMGVYKPFEPCVMSCRVGFRKPQREIYLKAAEMAGLRLHECLLVDDLVGNIEGARRAGMPGILFSDAAGLARDLSRWKLPV